MNPSEIKNFPRCTFDQSLEIGHSEIASLADPINILLKTSHLLGDSRDPEVALQSLFDIAEEIARADSCAYFAASPDSREFDLVASRHVPTEEAARAGLTAPADIVKHYGKVVHIVAEADPRFREVCGPWNAGSLAAYPMRSDRNTIGALVFGRKDPAVFSETDIKLLWVLAGHANNHLLQTETVKALSFYSFLDPLTHLYNRRYFDNQIEKEIFRSRRNGKTFSLLMLDLDGFKSYNDRFLHSAGDIALQEFATILRDSVREVDTVARFGGDEFAVILVESHSEGGRDLASRINARLARHFFPGMSAARTERLTSSIGIATFPTDSFDKVDLVRKADRALYMAKSREGGKICLFHEIADLLAVKAAPGDLPIQKIYNAARSVVDMDKFLEILLFTGMQGLSAERGSIVVIDPGGDCLLRAAIGFSHSEERFLPGKPLAAGPVTAWVMERKEPLVVSGPDDMPLPKRSKKNGYRTDSFLSLPLIHRDRLLGTLHLTNKRGGQSFTRDDLAAFAPIASRISAILAEGVTFRENVKSFSTSILESLTAALELRFPFMAGHSDRVRNIALRVGETIGLPPADLSALGTAASVHDIGIVGIPGTILSKKRKLTERELEIARKHPFLGSKLMEGVPGIDAARGIVLEHHEFFDGSGYPHGLKGVDIRIGARVLGVAEFYDSITSARPHRGGLRPDEAIQLIRNSANTLFDPAVVSAFVGLPRDLLTGSASSRS